MARNQQAAPSATPEFQGRRGNHLANHCIDTYMITYVSSVGYSWYIYKNDTSFLYLSLCTKINSKWTKGFINVRLLKHLEKKSGEDTAGGKCTPMCLHILPMSKVKDGQGQGTVTASSTALFKPETGMFAEAGHCLRTDMNKRAALAEGSHQLPCPECRATSSPAEILD